jgi:hypothetical protein
MADISDVEEAIKSLLTQLAYPLGTENASAVLDAEGKTHNTQIYRGWPQPNQLDVDMANGTVDVSVFSTRVEQNVTRYSLDYDVLPLPAPTLTLLVGVVSGGDVELEGGGEFLLEGGSGALELEGAPCLTVGGTVTVPQNVAAVVNGVGYSYAVQARDTLTSIATALAALINTNTPATSNGPVISVPTAYSIKPRIGVVGTALQEVARQKRNVMITLWCPSPDLRDNAAKLFDPVLKSTQFLSMPDGTGCRLIYVSSPVTDTVQKEEIYRRDLIYSCEYGTTIASQAPQVTILEVNVNGGVVPIGRIALESGGKLLLEDRTDLELESAFIENIYM